MRLLATLLIAGFYFHLLSIISCRRVTEYQGSLKEAIITGYDERACICCGGFLINFDGEIRPYKGQYYLIDNDITPFGVTQTQSFPIKVKVGYSSLSKCNGKYVYVTKLIMQKAKSYSD